MNQRSHARVHGGTTGAASPARFRAECRTDLLIRSGGLHGRQVRLQQLAGRISVAEAISNIAVEAHALEITVSALLSST